MQTTPRTRAILRSLPMCRTRTKPRTSRTPNPSDFEAAFCRRTYCNPKQNGGIFIAKLIVAEKPSVAMSYAKVLGATSRQDGYLEGNGYLVSWCVGHLLELAQPELTKNSTPNGGMRIFRSYRKTGNMKCQRIRKRSLPFCAG